ncbi:MAG: hypothetical protein K9L79_00455 [Methylobacter tundripaludum]|nr:hypothetical protein [Methylobacter tundripaludum]
MDEVDKKPTDQEINQALAVCLARQITDSSAYPALTYEDGVQAAIYWLIGYGESPFKD